MSNEIQILEAATSVDFSKDYADLSQKFDFGQGLTQFKARDGVTLDPTDLAKGIAVGYVLSRSGQWIIADAARQLEDMGHKDVVGQICASFGLAESTVYNAIKTGRRVTEPEDRKALEFTTYQEICTRRYDKDDEKNENTIAELITEAKSSGWNSTEARSHADLAQGKTREKKPEWNYLSITSAGPMKHLECPPPCNGTTIINLKNNQYLHEWAGKWEWSPIRREPTNEELKSVE